jgi:hypothetical protein
MNISLVEIVGRHGVDLFRVVGVHRTIETREPLCWGRGYDTGFAAACSLILPGILWIDQHTSTDVPSE